MSRLKTLPQRLGQLPGRLGRVAPVDEAARSRMRDASQVWRKWYKTKRWQRLRWSILVRDLFTCRRCGKVVSDTSQLVADHREPHRGDEALFWKEGNLQTLCKPCHDRDKQREERQGIW